MTRIAAGAVGAYALTLTANTVDTVTFGEDLDKLQVVSDGKAAIYITFGADSTPAVGSGDAWEIPATPCVATLPVPTAGSTVVKLISAGTPTYSLSKEA